MSGTCQEPFTAPTHFLGPRLARAGVRRKGDYDRALQDATEAIKLDPHNVHALACRAEVWVLRGDAERAISDASEAIRVEEHYASAFDARGRGWVLKQAYDKAIGDFDRGDPAGSAVHKRVSAPGPGPLGPKEGCGVARRRQRRPATRPEISNAPAICAE